MTRTEFRKRIGKLELWLNASADRFSKLAALQDSQYIKGIYEGKAESYKVFARTMGCVLKFADKLELAVTDINDIMLFCDMCGSEEGVELHGDELTPLCRRHRRCAIVSLDLAL